MHRPPSSTLFPYTTLFRSLRDQLPADAVVTNGAGNFSVWVHRYHRFRRYGTQLAPIAGSMGYGVPAAIADRKSTRLNSSHRCISYAVFCLKKKNRYIVYSE